MKLQVLDKILEQEFDKIVKTKDSILCCVKDKIFSTYKGINNWDIFKVIDGEFTKETDKEKLLVEQITKLTLDNKKKDDVAKNLIQALTKNTLDKCKLENQNKVIMTELTNIKLQLMKEGK